MVWSDSASELPAPRDDEPAHLRQDIHDELADHLQAALEREKRQETDEAAARERVLERFGDPRRVARKLWQDAMWEKLMSQRVQLVASVLTLVACAGMFCMTAVIANQGRAMHEAMLVRLDAIAKQAAPAPVNPEWNPTAVQLVTESGKPLPAGYTVELQGHESKFSHRESADQTGRVDFGLQRPGNYSVYVKAPWGESIAISKWVRAGSSTLIQIVCPAEPNRVEAPVTIKWPQAMDTPDLQLVCEIRPERLIEGQRWSRNERLWLMVDHSGHVAPIRGEFAMQMLQPASCAPACAAPAPTCTAPDTSIPPIPPNATRVPAIAMAEEKLELPGQSQARITFAVLKLQTINKLGLVATRVGTPLEAPLELHAGATPHWALTIPEDFNADAEKTADATAASSRTATR